MYSNPSSDNMLNTGRFVLYPFSGSLANTMMSMHVSLRRAHPCAAIIGFSGMLAAPEKLRKECISRPPICLIHGNVDPVVPFSGMEAAADTLSENGVIVQTHERSGLPHGIDAGGIEIAKTFLGNHFSL